MAVFMVIHLFSNGKILFQSSFIAYDRPTVCGGFVEALVKPADGRLAQPGKKANWPIECA
jgi:hypothetical protein